MLKKVVSKLDIFGQPIEIYYQGESSYKTKVGAFCSLCTMVIMMTYGAVRLQLLVNKGNTNIL
jgi:hypothetical protein